ncbi:hypothetical protein AYO21_00260 [Fonsecaea monophora]|uniref:F-box domain-containing protein n=1 Tax=Fonsecaea monophora TaxID=254056 RepID=A0A177FMS4_9EURO|nr:hypothetical protein AYO21_00260 [Fonsecaea monophora]OAG45624.1 hypothetical protein AYO21_00260 [Fonsecaea monophora]
METSLFTLPPEIRLQIWSYLVRPTTIYPCHCAERDKQLRLDACCNNSSSIYQDCDNRILRVSRQIFDEVQPVVERAESERLFVLCNSLSLDDFFKALHQSDWKWVKHLRVELFVGWAKDNQDDWFLCQMHRWAKRSVAGTLYKYDQGRELSIQPAEQAREDKNGRRTLTVDIYLA